VRRAPGRALAQGGNRRRIDRPAGRPDAIHRRCHRRLAFGDDVNTLESDDDVIQRHLDKIFPKLFTRLIAGVPYWRFFKTESDRALERSMQAVNTAIDGFITAARQRLADDPARRAAPQNLLEAMIVAADEPGSGIDHNRVAGNVLTMLLAGEDTTANTLSWCIWLLKQHPAALARAMAEVRGEWLADGPVTLDHLAQLDYVEACMHETMRLRPVAPQLLVQANRDTVVGDVAVPAGTVVIGVMRFDSVDDAFVPHGSQFAPNAGWERRPVGGLGQAHLDAVWSRPADVPWPLSGFAGNEDGAADAAQYVRDRIGGDRRRGRARRAADVRDGSGGPEDEAFTQGHCLVWRSVLGAAARPR
jgi:hypothetical protein